MENIGKAHGLPLLLLEQRGGQSDQDRHGQRQREKGGMQVGEVEGLREGAARDRQEMRGRRSEEHTSELQSLMRISYAVFCLKKKTKNDIYHQHISETMRH